MYNNDVGKESAQKFMKQTGDLKAATYMPMKLMKQNKGWRPLGRLFAS
jgi:hypothetical protein